MTEHYIKVTIMIPTYNQAIYIKEAVNSALSQTYPHLEVIVGDDASSDNTHEIMKEITDPRLRYFRNKKNLGRTENYKNLLNKHATGDFVVNLDGDDYYTDPEFISEVVKLINNEDDIVIVAARAGWTKENKVFLSNIPNIEEATGIEILNKLPNEKYFFKHMASVYSRQKAADIDFYRTDTNSSDWESLYRLALKGKVRYLDRNIGIWRIHEQNESGSADYKKHLNNLIVWFSIYRDAVSTGMNPFIAKLKAAECVAFTSQTSCVKISLSGNLNLIRYILSFMRKYKLASFLSLIKPKYIVRTLFCFLGYYRKKNNVSKVRS